METERICARISWSNALFLIAVPMVFVLVLLESAMGADSIGLRDLILISSGTVVLAIFGGFFVLTVMCRRYIELTPDGFRKTGLTKGRLYLWAECFEPVYNNRGDTVLMAGEPPKSIHLPLYGHPPQELADRFNAYRDQALAAMGRR